MDVSHPVEIQFGEGKLAEFAATVVGKRYAVCSYPDKPFDDVLNTLSKIAGDPALCIRDIAPNPDVSELAEQCARFNAAPNIDVIVAVGGGSVIDSAKVFAAARGDFERVMGYLGTGPTVSELAPLPLVAVPTTAGTGSEVTCWATVWDKAAGKKYSLARPDLYPRVAVVDPQLMLAKPLGLTVATGLDALSHALESIWNLNANPVSANYAVTAARDIMRDLPTLAKNLDSMALRSSLAKAATFSGMAFSNTKTALAHNISYPITINQGVAHGIACSFTLPVVLLSVAGSGGFREEALKAVFGQDLEAAARKLRDMMHDLDVSTRVSDYGIDQVEFQEIVTAAFDGERGRNFVGTRERFDAAALNLELVSA